MPTVSLHYSHTGRRCQLRASFSRRSIVRNQEYQALIGYLLGLAYLLWKVI